MKSLILGFMFTVSVGLTGAIYSSVNGRITTLEEDKKDLTSIVQELKTQTALMKQASDEFKSSTAQLNDRVDKLNEAREQTNRKLDTLILVLNKNSRDYQRAMDAWEFYFNTRKQ